MVVTHATICSVHSIGEHVIRVRLRPDQPVYFRPGQHVTLHRDNGVTRLYSIANTPAEAASDGIEFHVRLYRDGAMSAWLAGAGPGALIRMGTPAGSCCYLPGDPGRPLLLAGTGTGIAPLAAVLRDALAQGHTGPVVIIHGSASPAGLYLGRGPDGSYPRHGVGSPGEAAGQRRDSRGWPARVRWRTCLLSGDHDIADAVVAELRRLGDPAAVSAYLCGGTRTMPRMRRGLFMAGMSLRDIYADEFTPAAGRIRQARQ